MPRDPLARVVAGVPGGRAALKAMAELVGQIVAWPGADDDGREFAAIVLHDSAGTVRRRRRAARRIDRLMETERGDGV